MVGSTDSNVTARCQEKAVEGWKTEKVDKAESCESRDVYEGYDEPGHFDHHR
jgi:hypothetical protein